MSRSLLRLSFFAWHSGTSGRTRLVVGSGRLARPAIRLHGFHAFAGRAVPSGWPSVLAFPWPASVAVASRSASDARHAPPRTRSVSAVGYFRHSWPVASAAHPHFRPTSGAGLWSSDWWCRCYCWCYFRCCFRWCWPPSWPHYCYDPPASVPFAAVAAAEAPQSAGDGGGAAAAAAAANCTNVTDDGASEKTDSSCRSDPVFRPVFEMGAQNKNFAKTFYPYTTRKTAIIITVVWFCCMGRGGSAHVFVLGELLYRSLSVILRSVWSANVCIFITSSGQNLATHASVQT